MILAFDFGTTVLKGALLSEKGELKRFSSRELEMVQKKNGGLYEADPVQWKSSFKQIAAELLSERDVIPSIRAVAVSGNGPTLVPVGMGGESLNPVMSWMDRRATAEARLIKEMGDFYIDPTFYLPKALWLYRNMPDIYEKTRYFLSCPESIIFWLTGEAITILPGSRFEKYYWSPELIGKLGLDNSKFPEFAKPGTSPGRVTAVGAAESGLPEGIPVVASGPDFIVSLLGTATVSPGRACDRAGTSEGINLCTESFITDPRLMGYGHVIEPWFNVSGIISTSGRALDWIKNVVSSRDQEYKDFLGKIGGISPGSNRLIFLPYLAGERAPIWDPEAAGAFVGLRLSHGKEEMVKAVLESTGYAMRDVIEVMAENGAEITDLRLTGGPSMSDDWNQIKADITGKNLLVPESTEAALIGDLALALHAIGDSDNLADTAERLVRIKKVYEPRREKREIYNDMFNIYRKTYIGLKQVFNQLANIKEERDR